MNLQKDVTALPPMVAESWARSVQCGLRREDRALFSPSPSKAAAKRVVEEGDWMLQHARPEMLRLFNGLGSSRWLAMCLDARGNTLYTVADANSAPRKLKPLIDPGRSIVESALGTTAPGCSLASGRSATVTRDEHFLLELEDFFCASAPIMGPDGVLAGVLDVSGVGVDSVHLATDVVELAARRIENEIIAGQQECWIVQFH